jgi:pyruvate/2-oxoglutarate dehydrogenase complex dihydrolipoamide acyltransferase (E2) component
LKGNSVATEFKLPELGENIEAGDVVRIAVTAGETIKEGQTVVELETDKAVVEVPSTVSGVIQDVVVTPSQRVKVGDVLSTFTAADVAEEKPAEPTKSQEPPQAEPMSCSKEAAEMPLRILCLTLLFWSDAPDDLNVDRPRPVAIRTDHDSRFGRLKIDVGQLQDMTTLRHVCALSHCFTMVMSGRGIPLRGSIRVTPSQPTDRAVGSEVRLQRVPRHAQTMPSLPHQ